MARKILEIRGRLTVHRAERCLATLATTPATVPLTIDLSMCTHIDMGAGWRLGNALRRFDRSEANFSAIVPDPGDYSGPWFLTMTRSGLGQALAGRATHIRSSGRTLTKDIRTYYRLHSQTQTQNFVSVANVQDTIALVDDEATFVTRFDTWLPYLNFPPTSFPSRTDKAALHKLAYESLQNIRDHATKAPLTGAATVMSNLSLRYYKDTEIKAATGSTEEFDDYRERIPSCLPAGRRLRGFLEIVVSDDGVGVSARQSQRADIYESADLLAEITAVEEAFTAGGSVKLKISDAISRGTPGYGFTHISRALRRLAGFALVRTGRLAVTFDSSINLDVATFVISPTKRAYLPGTVVQIVIPIHDAVDDAETHDTRPPRPYPARVDQSSLF